MEALRNMERRIEEGFVLDDQGRWIHMAELRIYEKRVIDQLSNGNVLSDGKWIRIEEAQKMAKAAQLAQAAAFESVQNMLETVSINIPVKKTPAPDVSASVVKAKTPDAGANQGAITSAIDFSGSDDMRETAFFTIERTKLAQSPAVPPAPAPVAAAPANPPKAENASKSAEVDGVLLLGLSKTSAAEQSKYAMEYIEELNFTKKRKTMSNFLAAAAISLAIAAAAAIIVLQNFG